ncbi:MAG: hypothetical protein CSB28_00975 [Desulfobacterales bacterium]|nr:MAG: hypothetical protein CSB28_00975 [Desulfobacterales bacterium]
MLLSLFFFAQQKLFFRKFYSLKGKYFIASYREDNNCEALYRDITFVSIATTPNYPFKEDNRWH